MTKREWQDQDKKWPICYTFACFTYIKVHSHQSKSTMEYQYPLTVDCTGDFIKPWMFALQIRNLMLCSKEFNFSRFWNHCLGTRLTSGSWLSRFAGESLTKIWRKILWISLMKLSNTLTQLAIAQWKHFPIPTKSIRKTPSLWGKIWNSILTCNQCSHILTLQSGQT